MDRVQIEFFIFYLGVFCPFMVVIVFNIAKAKAFSMRLQKGQYYPLFKRVENYDYKMEDELDENIDFKFDPNKLK